MIQLLLAILGIAIAASLLAMGMGWVTPNIAVKQATAAIADSGFRSLEMAAMSYRVDAGAAPTPGAAVAALGLGAPLTELVPAYVDPPKAPDGMTWTYGSDNPGQALWVCLSGDAVTLPEWQGLAKAMMARPVGSAALDAGCRAPADGDGTSAPATPAVFPTTTALTYRVF